MQIQKKPLGGAASIAELKALKEDKNTLRAINRYLSEVESAKADVHAPFDGKKTVFGNGRPDLVSNYRRKLKLQASQEQQHSIFLQSKLSNALSDTNKYFSQKQIEDIDKSTEISKLMKEVEEQRTIIQLQDELIRRLMSKSQNKDPNIEKFSFDGQNSDKISSIFSRLKEVREILEFLNE